MKKLIKYDGKIIGLNEYKSLHWRKREAIIKKIKPLLLQKIMAARVPRLLYMELRTFHNTNFDLDNLTGTIKVFVDLLRHCGIIKDDTKRFFDYMSIQYTPQIPKGSLYFEITGEVKQKSL